jgi:hypothetical protein
MATQLGQQSDFWDVPIFNATIPPEGPKALSCQAKFTPSNTTFNIDFTLVQSQKKMSVVQGVFVDNSANASPVLIASSTLSQSIVFPAFSQGYIPLLSPKPTQFVVTNQNGGTALVGFIFLNVPVPALIWSSGQAQVVTPSGVASFAIVAGGTAQVVFAAGSIATGAFITNPSGASESLFVDPVNAAQVSITGGTYGTTTELKPGYSYLCKPSSKAVSVNAATTGHAFIAVQY